jgi:hypothetical protein
MELWHLARPKLVGEVNVCYNADVEEMMVSDGRPLIHHKREPVSCVEVGLELLLGLLMQPEDTAA